MAARFFAIIGRLNDELLLMTALPSALPSSREDALPAAHRRADRLAAIGAPLVEWLVASALPLWSTAGVDRAQGGFFEKLGPDGAPIEEPRRARVVARQIYVFATAARNGWLLGADSLVDHGLDFLLAKLKKPDGTIAAAVAPDGSLRNGAFDLYEHAFVLFALAAAYRNDPERVALRAEAEALLGHLRSRWSHPQGGFEEAAPRTLPLKSNPHMHLLEAALAWTEITDGASRELWASLADELVELCLERFIDANGALHEYFDGDWRPMPGREGHVVEPGHQFEWAWLLMRSAGHDRQSSARRLAAAARLLEIGEAHGVDAVRGVAVNELDDAFRVTDAAAKLWPQTERIKAWHFAARLAGPHDAPAAEAALQAAVGGLKHYLPMALNGLWREQMEVDGRFVVPGSRASSLYHIVCAIDSFAGPRPGSSA